MIRRWAWAGSLAGGLVLVGVYFVIPSTHVQNVLYEVIGALGVVGILVGVRLHRPARRAPWFLIATGAGLLVAGDVAWTVYAWLGDTPYPSFADVIYLCAYPFLAAGLLRLRRPPTRTLDRARLVETAVITMGAALLMWEPYFEAYAMDPVLPLVERLVSLAYPLADLLLIAVLIRLSVGVASRTLSYGILVASVLSALAADLVYSILAIQGTYYTGHPVDAGYLLFYVFLGVAALHPSMRTLSEPSLPPPARLTRVRLALLAGSALLAPATIWREQVSGQDRSVYVLLAVAAFVFVLVLYRMSLLVREVASKAEALDRQGESLQAAVTRLRRAQDERKRLLARTLRAAEEERVQIAADLHDGPVQRMAMLGYSLERGRLRLRRGDTDGADEILVNTQHGLSHEVHDLRRLMASLRPPALDEQGLEGALRDHVDAFRSRVNVEMEVRAQLDRRPAPEVETVLYRVVQEALQNVSKHARASRVWVDVRQRNGSVELAVRDDGVGFDPKIETGLIEDHFGLAAMKEQVKMAGGRWEISSAPGRGTEVRAVVPAGGPR
jgi:signal transduction histidine kinase